MHFPIADATVSPLLLALLGMIVGTMTGFFGVGGGFLITGGLLVLGVPTIYAVGTGLLMVMGTAITSTLRHRRWATWISGLPFSSSAGPSPACSPANGSTRRWSMLE